MERLNDIMRRTPQRRQTPQQRPLEGHRPGLSALHRSLPEQSAHLNQQSGQLHNQQNISARSSNEQAGTRTGRSSQQSMLQAPRSSYMRPYLQGNEDEIDDFSSDQQRLHHLQEFQHRKDGMDSARLSHDRGWSNTKGSHFDQVDAYPSLSSADVREEWEDDTAGMRYGDWENDTDNEQRLPRARLEGFSRVNRSLATRELSTSTHQETIPTRNLRNSRIPGPPAHLPSPQALQQELAHLHRATQPLNPQSLMRMNQDYPQEAPVPQQTEQQVELPEQSTPPIPAPYTSPIQVCPICKGAGYLRVDVPYGHPNFGKPIACECKETEIKAKRRRQLYDISNLGDLKNKNFDNFRPNASRVAYQAYQVALEYSQEPQGWLVLIGRVGCGKTHLAAAIANRCLARGSLVLFSTVSDLLDHLRATYMPDAKEVYDQRFDKMREAELLVLDDLGAQQSSPWANEKLFQLLNYRYNSRFPTIITTNNAGLQGIEERIRSRMMDASLVTIVTFDGAQDYRPRNPRRE